MNSNNTNHPETLDDLLRLAREHQPDTAPAEFGFETRLTQRIGELRATANNGIWDEMVRWIWGSAAGVAPVVAILLVWLVLGSDLSLTSFQDFSGINNLTDLYSLSLDGN